MKQKEFTFVALRIFAVFILIQSFIDLSQIINYYLLPTFYDEMQELVQTKIINTIVSFGPFLIQIIMSVVIWVYAEKISRFFIPKSKRTLNQDEPNNNQPSITVHQFQVAAVSVVGLALIVYTLPSFFPLAQSWLNIKEIGLDYAETKMKGELLFSFLEKLLRLVLGFVLLFGSSGLAGLLKRIREL